MGLEPSRSESSAVSASLGSEIAPRLVTERLVLRRATMFDLSDVHEVLSNEVAMRFWSRPPHGHLDETREWLRSMVEASPEESNDFVVELDSRVIGKAGCWRLPEIGFILHPDHWGIGLAAEALTAAITSTFSRFSIPTIEADVDPRNLASLRLLRRLGFHQTGSAERTFCLAGEWVDSVYLALRREDWGG